MTCAISIDVVNAMLCTIPQHKFQHQSYTHHSAPQFFFSSTNFLSFIHQFQTLILYFSTSVMLQLMQFSTFNFLNIYYCYSLLGTDEVTPLNLLVIVNSVLFKKKNN